MSKFYRHLSLVRLNTLSIVTLFFSFQNVFSQAEEAKVYRMENIHSKIELFCTDFAVSIEFYKKLGFQLLLQKEDDYSIMKRHQFIIAISPVKKSRSLRIHRRFKLPPHGIEIVFYTDRLNELRYELIQQGISTTEIIRQPWGLNDFRLTDPDGYYIRISEYPKEE